MFVLIMTPDTFMRFRHVKKKKNLTKECMNVLKKPEKKLGFFYHRFYGLSVQCTPSQELQSIESFIKLLAEMW